jgi:hypothetical protein
MSYTGMDFMINYDDLLDELSSTLKPEFREIIFRYRFTDPHDLVGPDTYFETRYEMLRHLSILIWIDYQENDPVHRN